MRTAPAPAAGRRARRCSATSARITAPIKTANADAQKFFDEGLTLLYGFNHEESFKSFERAAALDAGVADAALGHVARARHQHQRRGAGRSVEAGATRTWPKRRSARPPAATWSRDWSTRSASATSPIPTGDQMVREQAYSDAMGALSKKFPDDLDVATLYAESLMNLRPWRLYTKDGTPEPGTDTIVAHARRRDEARTRNHPGANHYYIHAVEASKTPDRALPQAGRLETLVPGAGHLVHMPAHIYIRTGQYAKSAKSNADAAAVDEKYFKATGANGLYPMMYYGAQPAVRIRGGDVRRQPRAGARGGAAHRQVRRSDRRSDGDDRAVRGAGARGAGALRPVGRRFSRRSRRRRRALLQTALYHFARGAALAAHRQDRGGRGRSRRAEGGGREDPEGRDGRRRRIPPSTSIAVAIADLDGAHRRSEGRHRRRDQGLHRGGRRRGSSSATTSRPTG